MNAIATTQDRSKLTAEQLRAAVFYDPATGIFTRKINSSRMKAGDPCGSMHKKGHLEFFVLSKLHKAHRLAWLYMTGEWPRGMIDHINGDKTCNSWSNLRDVDNRTNSENRSRANKNNILGVLGIHRHKTGKFEPRIRVDGQAIYLGLYETVEEAKAIHLAAKIKFHEGATA